MKPNSFIFDTVTSCAASFLAIAVNSVMVLAVLARILPETDFKNYLLIRRLIACVVPVVTLSLSVGLKYFQSRFHSRPDRQQEILLSALVGTILCFGCCLLVVSLSGYRQFLRYFEVPSSHCMVVALAVWIAGFCFFTLLYASGFGSFRVRTANIHLLVYNGAVPFLCLAVAAQLSPSDRLEGFLFAYGAASCTSLVLLLFRCGAKAPPFSRLASDIWLLCCYCVPRIPAGVLYAFPPLYLAMRLERSGIDSFVFLACLLPLQVLRHAVAPMGNVMLPWASRMMDASRMEEKKRDFGMLLEVFFTLGILLVPQVAIWGGIVLHFWFHARPEPFWEPMWILAPCVVAGIMYIPLRSLIDAISPKALCTAFLALSVAVVWGGAESVACWGHFSVLWACLLYTAGYLTFMLVSIAYIWNRVKPTLSCHYLAQTGLLSAILGGGSTLLSLWYWSKPGAVSGLTGLLIAVLLFFVVTYLWIRRHRVAWLRVFPDMKRFY